MSLVETVAMTAVTVGFVIGQATSTRQSPIYKAILDFDTDDVPYLTLIGISAVRLLLGYALVLLTRLLCKIVFRSLLSNLFRILDMECFDRKKTKYDQSIRLYSASFKLPPVFVKEGKKKRKSQPDPDDASAKWNMDYLVNYGTYICVGWMAISGVPLLSHSIGLVL